MSMMENFIKVEGLVKEYENGRINALRGVYLEVRRGEFLAIMGPSGSGKSTLLNLIGALDTPTSGTIIIDGEDITSLSPRLLARFRAKKVGFIFQSFNLLPTLTALENVQIPMFESNLSHREKEERSRQLLFNVGLSERLHSVPSKLSGGERQRVAIARALANDPQIILADEPTGNLDSMTSKEILSLLHHINREKGVTFILVTHDREIADGAHRIVRMLDGRVM